MEIVGSVFVQKEIYSLSTSFSANKLLFFWQCQEMRYVA